MATSKKPTSKPASRAKAEKEAQDPDLQAADAPTAADPIMTRTDLPAGGAALPADGLGGSNVPVSERPDAESSDKDDNAS